MKTRSYSVAAAVACGALVTLAAGPSRASSIACVQPGTQLVFPPDGGSLPLSSGLVILDRSCFPQAGAPLPSMPAFMAVEELEVTIDGQPAALVSMDVPGGALWRIEPAEALVVGAAVRIFGCDEADREAQRCFGEVDEWPEGHAIDWSLTVGEARPDVELVAPELSVPERTGKADPAGGNDNTLWTFSVTRAADDPLHPMLVELTMDPGDAHLELAWARETDVAQELVFGAPEERHVCVQARTFDLRGEEGPSASECSEGCGCTTGGDASSLGALALMLLGLRRRRRGGAQPWCS